MPFIKITSNVSISAEQVDQIKFRCGTAITAIPGKSEGWLMVGIEGDSMLYFRGTDEPAAIAEVSLYGSASSQALNTLTSHITGILTEILGISSDRIYVSYQCTDHWGWNGANF